MPPRAVALQAVPIRILLAGTLIMGMACTAGQDGAAGRSEVPEATGSGPAPDPTASGTEVEDPATRAQLEWFLSVLGGSSTGAPLADGQVLDQATYGRRFAEPFRNQVPFEQFAAITGQLAASGPFTLGAVTPDGPGLTAEAAGRDGSTITIDIATDASGQIAGLFIQPGEPPILEDPPESLAEAQQRLTDLGRVRFLAAEVEGSGGDVACAPVVALDADDQAPIGSAFKLYVLAAVIDAVAAGDLGWDTGLTLTEGDKSLPSGTLQTRPAGTVVTVEEAARAMISISDNTATDLLMRTVGRDAVESAQGRYGHSQPDRNIPFMTTRELFALKVAAGDIQDRFVTGNEQQRRAVLDGLPEVDITQIPLSTLTGAPLRPDDLEWFASPRDLCIVMARLLDRADEPGLQPLGPILTTNPGIPDPAGLWQRIAFKGGSEPGLITTVWVMEDAAGSRFALVGSVLDTDQPLEETQTLLLLGAARDLLTNGGG